MNKPPEYEDGVHDIPEETYFALPHFSNSDLKNINRSPAHYWYDKYEKPADDPTPAQLIGKILHTAILEPEKFDQHFVVLPPDAPKRPTKAQRNAKKPNEASQLAMQWWDAWEGANAHRTIIDAEKGTEFKRIADSIRAHPELKPFMKKGRAELSMLATDPETDLPVRCRPDWMCRVDKHLVVIDYKSAEDARPGPFSRNAYNYGYFQQAAFYLDVITWAYGQRPDIFLFAAFEKTPPYAVKLYEVTPEAIIRAGEGYRSALHIAKACLESTEWPSYPTDIEPIEYPKWAKD